MAALSLLLVGRTGNGKSSTGNSILGKKEFTPRSTSSSVSYDIKMKDTLIGDKTVTIIDGPGVGDYSTDVTEDGQSMIELVEKTLSMTSYTFHALLFVLKYGVRFTRQEQDAVKMINLIFGHDILKNHGIIIMTHGDSFDLDTEDDNTTFEAWCSEQTGDFHALLSECQNRCVLFNNVSEDQSKISSQIEQLMKTVTTITANTHPYTKEDFEKAEHGRKRLLVKDKLPELDSKTEIVLNGIIKKLDQIGKEEGHDHVKNIEELKQMSSDLQKHVDFLEKEDQGTKSVGQILTRISIIKTRIKTMTDFQILKVESVKRKQKQPDTKLPSGKEPNFLWKLLSSHWPLFCITVGVGVIYAYRRKLVGMFLKE